MEKNIQEKLDKLEKSIGKTPMVDLGNGIYGKLEGTNPAGSVKDRAAFFIIKRAIELGKLDGGVIVEATSGNTGIGLAFVARELGFKCILTMPESMSSERRELLAAYGAELVLTPAAEGMAGAVKAAKEICAEKNAFFADQFSNYASVEAHFYTTAPEIFKELPTVKYVVCGVGSGGTAMGIKRFIEEKGVDCKVVAVEPENSPLMSNGITGAHKIQGIGANFLPALVNVEKLDKIMTVSDTSAFIAVRNIYKITGEKCGISSGAAYSAATVLRKEVNGDISVIFPDNGDRYPQNIYN